MLDKLIRDAEISLYILKRRAAGAPFSAIAQSLGMVKSTVYQRYCTIVNTMPKRFRDTDGEIIEPGQRMTRDDLFMGEADLPKNQDPEEI